MRAARFWTRSLGLRPLLSGFPTPDVPAIRGPAASRKARGGELEDVDLGLKGVTAGVAGGSKGMGLATTRSLAGEARGSSCSPGRDGRWRRRSVSCQRRGAPTPYPSTRPSVRDDPRDGNQVVAEEPVAAQRSCSAGVEDVRPSHPFVAGADPELDQVQLRGDLRKLRHGHGRHQEDRIPAVTGRPVDAVHGEPAVGSHPCGGRRAGDEV